MESVSDDQKKQEALAALIHLAEFPNLARFALYQQAFAEEFPRVAPDAMSDLISLVPVGIRWAGAELGSPKRMKYRIDLSDGVIAWCENWNLNVQWVWVVGTLTVITSAFNQLQGIPMPKSLVVSISPNLQELDGELWSILEEAKILPVAEIDIHVRPSVYTWDPLKETKAQFRKRAQQEFLGQLDEELAFASEVSDITPIDVKYQWVQWLILKRVLDRSINSIARDYQTNQEHPDRKTVRDGISAAQQILFVNPRGGGIT